MNRKSLVTRSLLLIFGASLAVAAEPPNSSDLNLTGSVTGSSAASVEAAALDKSKIDYLLLLDRKDGSFDAFHDRVAAAFASRGTQGDKLAIEAATSLATVKKAIDAAYEEFLGAAAKLKEASGIDILQAGTGTLDDGIAGLDTASAARARAQLPIAGASAAKVVSLRATYRQLAARFASQLPPAR